MIYNSYIWKEDLRKKERKIESLCDQPIMENEDSLDIFEKEVFLSAFIIRKLIDSKSKVSDTIDNYCLRIDKLSAKKDGISLISSHKVNKYYDLLNSSEQNVSLNCICNQLIHSYVFELVFSDKGFIEGFFVSSDREKDQQLFYVDIKKWLRAINYVANDEVKEARMIYDEKRKDYSLIKVRK